MPNSQRLKKFKGKTADEIWEGLLKGTIKLDKDYELEMAKKLKQIQEFKRVISRGVRTPEEIIAEYPKERKVKVSNY